MHLWRLVLGKDHCCSAMLLKQLHISTPHGPQDREVQEKMRRVLKRLGGTQTHMTRTSNGVQMLKVFQVLRVFRVSKMRQMLLTLTPMPQLKKHCQRQLWLWQD